MVASTTRALRSTFRGRWGAVAGRLSRTIALMSVLGAATSACGSSEVESLADPELRTPRTSLPSTLASATGNRQYRVDSVAGASGRISGVIRFNGEWPESESMRATHDLHVCDERTEFPVVGDNDGVGDALVWLVGVEHGPEDESARRVSLVLDGCVLSPRVQRAPVGATLLVSSQDNMDVRLRFADVAAADDAQAPGADAASVTPRALVVLGDAGALVPVSTVLNAPGLVAVTDDKHPWVSAWIAVAPHPFVAVSDGAGRFAFDGVPPGSYTLVAWHERLGRVAMPVVVDAGVETRLTVTLEAPE